MTPAGTARHDARVIVYLSLGSNLGDRLVYLREALNSLERHPHLVIDAVSSVYETDPVGMIEQPAFLNIVVRVKTSLEPYSLLHICQEIENQFQREREIRWGPRTLDIDLLMYDDLTMSTEELTLPHPRMHERKFVQIPLRELQTGKVGVSEGVRPLYTNWYKT